MKKIIALLLCISLAAGFSGCKKEEKTSAREESGGTGYGTARTGALIEQDLYFLRPYAERAAVEEALGSPQTFVISDGNSCTYRLSKGEELTLKYTEADKLESAQYKDAEGKTQDLFAYLNSIGVLVNYSSGETVEPEKQPEQEKEPTQEQPEQEQGGYFSQKKYSYAMAEQILKVGALRETVISALGKPNGFSSVDFAKDGYIIDVYLMEDGSTLYLDYGYARTKLRAAQTEKGGNVTTYLGEWGAEPKPDGIYRGDRNRHLFNSLKKNTKPSEIYSRFGAPDWLEGNADHYRDAYLLQDGSVLYMDFGDGHSLLTAASIAKFDGGITPIQLR